MIPPKRMYVEIVQNHEDQVLILTEEWGLVVVPKREIWEPTDVSTLEVGTKTTVEINGWWWHGEGSRSGG